MTEHEIQNQIRLELSKYGFCVFRINAGKIRLLDGRWFDTGAPKGFSDLFAVKDGKVYFIEVKTPEGKPTKEQTNFLAVMRNIYGCVTGIARSAEDALKLVGVDTNDT